LDLLGAFEDVEGLIWTYPLGSVGAHFYPLTWGNADRCCPLVTGGYPCSRAKIGMPRLFRKGAQPSAMRIPTPSYSSVTDERPRREAAQVWQLLKLLPAVCSAGRWSAEMQECRTRLERLLRHAEKLRADDNTG
jgi:hypothetical protein